MSVEYEQQMYIHMQTGTQCTTKVVYVNQTLLNRMCMMTDKGHWLILNNLIRLLQISTLEGTHKKCFVTFVNTAVNINYVTRYSLALSIQSTFKTCN